MFEKAKWIASREVGKTEAPIFRKEFDAKAGVSKAVLYACGLGLGMYYVNGKKVTDEVLLTPLTRFDKRLLFNEFDVTALVQEGGNCVGVELGNGWYNDIGAVWDFEKADWRHHPKLILQLDVTYADGSVESIVSNSSWKASTGALVYNHVRHGEKYDARLEKCGWNTFGYNESDWCDTFVCRSPGGIMYLAVHTPIRITGTFNVQKKIGNVLDFGQNMSGWVKIKGKGNAGDTVTLIYSERQNDDGTLDTENINAFRAGEQPHTDIYIFKGEGVEEYAPKFVYHGFRYVEVQGAPEGLEVIAEVVHTDFTIVGEFECSDDMLNKIHMLGRWATLTNFHGIPTDCPHREQNGWTGDALISTDQALMNYDIVSCYKKWLNDFKDVQRPSGQIPGIVPTSGWGYNWGSGPAWDSAMVQIPYLIYNYTGDKSAIEQMWDNNELYMGFMDSMAEDYIVNYGLGDWLPPKGAKICPEVVTDTGYYYANAMFMAKSAKAIGKCAAKYEELAANIKAAFRAKFIKDGIVESDSQTSTACAIYWGLYNQDEIPAAAAHLNELVKEKDYHIDCGILGTKYIFTALSENGYIDTLYKMVTNPTMPSYAYWVHQGMTTMGEEWDMTNSRNHHMFSEVCLWFYKHVAGIRLSPEGLVIRPYFISELDWVKAKHKDISVCWNKEYIEVTSPTDFTLELGGKSIPLNSGTHKVMR